MYVVLQDSPIEFHDNDDDVIVIDDPMCVEDDEAIRLMPNSPSRFGHRLESIRATTISEGWLESRASAMAMREMMLERGYSCPVAPSSQRQPSFELPCQSSTGMNDSSADEAVIIFKLQLCCLAFVRLFFDYKYCDF